MAKKDRTPIVLGVLTLVGVLGGALFSNWDKIVRPVVKPPMSSTTQAPVTTQTAGGSGNVQISGSNNVVNPPPAQKPCRDKSHGVERYARTFDVERSSNWMGGGYNQDSWCNQVVSELRGQHPEGTFEVIGKSEDSKDTCPPFNCRQYQYNCKVRVGTDPIYIEKTSSACK